jgi:hypothetical protein
VGEAALRYALLGIPVFPCKTDKKPLVKWSREATRNPAQIIEWWAQWPKAMIGLVTGSRSGLVVLDIDVKNDVDGFESLGQQGILLPEGALKVQTPSGGAHYYFALRPQEKINNSAGRIAAGVDVRGEGGYVIAPPSVGGAGKSYQFASSFDFASLKELLS